MKVERKRINDHLSEYSYSLVGETVDAKVDEVLRVYYKKHAKLPGFRRGKAPVDAIRIRFKKEINDWVSSEMVSEAFRDIVYDQKIIPFGKAVAKHFEVTGSKLTNNKFKCVMEIYNIPEFELAECKGMSLPKPHLDTDVETEKEKALQDLRVKFGDAVPFEDGDIVENGDKVTMDVDATIDGVTFPEGCAQGVIYSLGNNQDLDKELIGMVPGDIREFVKKDQDGRDVLLKVTIHSGLKNKPASLSDEFAAQFEFDSLAALEEHLRGMAAQKIKHTTDAELRNQVSKRLLLDNEFDIPVEFLEEDAKKLALADKLNWDELDSDVKQTYLDRSENPVKLGIILMKLSSDEPESHLSDEEAKVILGNNIANSAYNLEQYIEALRKADMLHETLSNIKNQYILQWVVDNANIVE